MLYGNFDIVHRFHVVAIQKGYFAKYFSDLSNHFFFLKIEMPFFRVRDVFIFLNNIDRIITR